MRQDLGRQHAFAAERVGVLYCRFSHLPRKGLLVLAHHYVVVPDQQYLDDPRFGAVIDPDAFRDIVQHVYDYAVGAFHVHMHPGRGMPGPSHDDLDETAKFVPDFFHGRQEVPHGALILSQSALSGRIWLSENGKPRGIDEIRVIGSASQRIGGAL
jgi:hypothetical protein